jgi:hypothetical protein
MRLLSSGVKEDRVKHGEIESPSPPEGEYDLIYADPPWRYEHSMSDSREDRESLPDDDARPNKGSAGAGL